MTDQPSDPLAPIRAKAPFAMATIVVYGCTMDIVVDKRGTLFPFEVTAEHGEQHYAQNVADLRALAAALRRGVAPDELAGHTGVDPWFLTRLQNIVGMEKQVSSPQDRPLSFGRIVARSTPRRWSTGRACARDSS